MIWGTVMAVDVPLAGFGQGYDAMNFSLLLYLYVLS